MNIKNLIQNPHFKDKHILFLIIEHILGYKKEQIYLNREKEISNNDLKKIENIYNKYEKENIPIEYLLGYCKFMGENFIVNENTLIPRPETEYLIKYVLDYLTNFTNLTDLNKTKDKIPIHSKINSKNIFGKSSDKSSEISFKFSTLSSQHFLLDVGTGSGIIGIMLNKLTKLPTICIDIDEKTLEVAKKNNKKINPNSKNITFIKSDLLSSLNKYFISNNPDSIPKSGINPEILTQSQNPEYIVCANLPYLEENYKLDKLTEKEPKKALYAGKDGLDLYRKLLEQLNKINSKKVCFFELTSKQAQILINEYNFKNYKILETCHKNIKILEIIYK